MRGRPDWLSKKQDRRRKMCGCNLHYSLLCSCTHKKRFTSLLAVQRRFRKLESSPPRSGNLGKWNLSAAQRRFRKKCSPLRDPHGSSPRSGAKRNRALSAATVQRCFRRMGPLRRAVALLTGMKTSREPSAAQRRFRKMEPSGAAALRGKWDLSAAQR